MSHYLKYRLILTAILSAAILLIVGATKYNLAVMASSEWKALPTVILDAGHGGEDGGATSITGVSESKLNLEIALRTEQVLALSGYAPKMIRETDTAVYTGDCQTITEKKVSDLKNRVDMVNEIENGILLSIHQNHFSEKKYSGAQVFYSDTEGSKVLAERTQLLLRQSLAPDNKREIKRSTSVYLMEHIQCPGILIECGFLSNPEEDQLLQNENYQKKLSMVLCTAVQQYLNEGEDDHEI